MIWSIVTTVVVVVLVLVIWKYALPPLQTSPSPKASTSADLMAIRKVEDSVLTTYQLLDDDTRTCRIPIERAMELIATDSPAVSR